MSYLVFARKWRPQNFDEVIGQEHVATTLKNAISSSRIAHAYIFCGPRGVGKTSTARIFAKALNCQKGVSINPCNVCPACKEISSGSSLDVLEIDGASNRGIDEIRQLRENIKFSPSSGKFKIYIIDEVHMLTVEAFNALLKTLEEPPEHAKFIFATTMPNKVLPTILSRCQRFDFRKVPIPKIAQKLAEIAKLEHIKIEESVLIAIAKAADGSLRDAESILDQLISYSTDKISIKNLSSILGLIEQDVLFEFGKKIIEADTPALLKLLDSLVSSGKDLSQLLDSLIEYFRNLMIARISDSKRGVDLADLPQEFAEAIHKQSKLLSLDKILNVLELLINVKDLGKRINSLRIPLEIAFVRLTQGSNEIADKKSDGDEFLDKRPLAGEAIIKNIPEAIKNERGSISIPEANESEKIPEKIIESSGNIDLSMVNSSWNSFLNIIGKSKMSVATYLSDGRLERCEANIIEISLPKNSDFQKEFLEHKDNLALMEQTFSQLLGARMRVNFLISQREAEARAEEDNFVKGVLDKFKGRVV